MKSIIIKFLFTIKHIFYMILLFIFGIMTVRQEKLIYSLITLIPIILLGTFAMSYKRHQNQLKNDKDIYVNTEETIKYKFLYKKEKIKGSLVSFYYICWERLHQILFSLEIVPLLLYVLIYLFLKKYILIPIIILSIYSIIVIVIWYTLPKRFPKIAEKKYPHYKQMVYKDCLKD